MHNRRSVLVRCAAVLPVLAGPLVLSALTALRDEPFAVHWPLFRVKMENAVSPFINYDFVLDMISAVLIYGGIAVGVASGWLVLAPGAAVTVCVLAVAYALCPFDLMSGSFLDMRLAVMLGFVVFAAVDQTVHSRPIRRLIATGWIMVFTIRMAVVAAAWSGHGQDLTQLRAVIAHVPPGATVYVSNVPQEEAPAYWNAGPLSRRLSNGLRADYHLPALLLIERRAFWPGLFANPAQQPIHLQPRYARLAQQAHELPSHAVLVAHPELAPATLRDFDFVLLLEAGADSDLANFIPACLQPIADSDFAALFRVRHDAPSCVAEPAP